MAHVKFVFFFFVILLDQSLPLVAFIFREGVDAHAFHEE
jgi:hypothetical protein